MASQRLVTSGDSSEKGSAPVGASALLVTSRAPVRGTSGTTVSGADPERLSAVAPEPASKRALHTHQAPFLSLCTTHQLLPLPLCSSASSLHK